MNIKRRDLKPYPGNLVRFFGKQMSMEGVVKLRVTLGTWPSVVSMDVDFLIVNTPNIAYNAILGRMSLNKAKAIVLTPYLMMKFLTPCGID